MKTIETSTKKRFTTLIDNNLLSQIKLISYFTNQKLNETINNSLKDYIDNFEKSNNTKLNSIIDLQNNFTSFTTPTDTANTEDKESNTKSK